MSAESNRRIAGILFDLDGVFYVGDDLIPGAIETLDFLAEHQLSYCFITDTTTQSAEELQHKLWGMGIPCRQNQLITAPVATANYLEHAAITRCFFAVNDSVLDDFPLVDAVEVKPQAVVVGDIGDRWNYDLLDQIFQHLLSGAVLVAMHRNKYWQNAGGLHVDIGAFIAGLEYVSESKAVITGKPSVAFFKAALKYLGVDKDQALLVGDDIHSDIGGAQSAGIRAALVQAGKYRRELVQASGIQPDHLLSSIAEVPSLITSRQI